MTVLSGFYQLPDDASPAGRTQVEADLLNFLDGQLLYASGTDVPVTAPVNEIVVSSGTAYPVVITNTVDSQVPILYGNDVQSEISFTLLGVPKEERQLGLFSVVNSYGADPQNWRTNTGGAADYTYYYDPTITPLLASTDIIRAKLSPKVRCRLTCIRRRVALNIYSMTALVVSLAITPTV
jgi:hypothetical protein